MQNKYIFIKSEMSYGKVKFRPLQGQCKGNGIPVIHKLHVRINPRTQKKYPENEVLAVTRLDLKASCKDKDYLFYETGKAFPVMLDGQFVTDDRRLRSEYNKVLRRLSRIS